MEQRQAATPATHAFAERNERLDLVRVEGQGVGNNLPATVALLVRLLAIVHKPNGLHFQVVPIIFLPLSKSRNRFGSAALLRFFVKLAAARKFPFAKCH